MASAPDLGRRTLHPQETESDPKNCRYTTRKPNLWDRITFGHLTRVILKGSWTTIEGKDLNPLHTLFTAKDASEKLLRIWRRKYKRIRQPESGECPADPTSGGPGDTEVLIQPDSKPISISMLWLVFRAFWPFFLLAFFCKLVQLSVDLVPPFLIGYLLDFLKDPSRPDVTGYYIAGVLLVAQQMSSLLNAHIYGTLYNVGIKCRSGFSSAIYQKALRLSSKSTKEFSTGDIVNMISVDLENVMWSVTMSVSLWGSPINVLVSFVIVYQYLGIYCLAGAAMMLVFAPFSVAMTKIESMLQTSHMKKKDQRIELLTELFNNVKIIKLHAWEHSFMARVRKLRAQESRLMYVYLGACNAFGFAWNCYPFLISTAAIGAYMFLDTQNTITPKKVLVALSYFNLIRFDLTIFPYAISLIVKAYVSLNRIRRFLEADEVDRGVVREDGLERDEEVALKNATLSWTMAEKPVLHEINFSMKKGELVAVVGSVAAGKSSLVQAIIGEMRPLIGSVHRRRTSRIAYVPQQAWVLNNTIRQNILFDKPSSPAFHEVVKKCCLVPDLQTLPAGDATEIGEKGVNLSGGQKQRISLARAVYQDADIYLLDDPLSAVDAHVAQSLFADIIGPEGLLSHKTRLLVTHSVAILPYVDRIVVLEDGRITHQGTYEEIMRSNVRLKELIETHANTTTDEYAQNTADSPTGGERNGSEDDRERADRLGSDGTGVSAARQDESRPLTTSRRRTKSVVSVASTSSEAARAERHFSNIPSGRMIHEEDVEIGKVRWSVYFEFLKQFGFFATFVTLAGYTIFRAADAYSILYITKWAEQMADRGNRSTVAYMWSHMEVYLGLGGIQAFSILCGLTALSIGCVWTSSRLHNNMLYAILRAPMSFFDSTPTGRILNRFSRDVDELDLSFYSTMDGYLETELGLMVLLVMICIQIPSFLVLLAPLMMLFASIQQFYMASARQIKRLNAITKSPVLNSFNESIAGAVSIRAYATEANFISHNMRLLDNNQNCMFHEYNGYRWLAIRLNVIGQLMDTAVCCLVTYMRNQMDPTTAAIVFSFALEASTALTWIVRLGAQVENSLVSAERVIEYGKTKPEADWDVKGEQVSSSWPSRGEVRFENYSTRYRDNLDLVLRGINLKVNAGERVGIVGRTGAGKSSLTLALLRIIEATEGRIYIDDIDIAKLGLHTLRSRVAMIPQDPVLFKGTLRDNVDPEKRYTDEQVWTALERAHLKTTDKPISFEVDEGGQNLSVGERQLVCLSRALLRPTALLVLDEATAAVDLDTDALIQTTIREDFKGCTILTIAHRLHTIMDYDKIVVLDRGQVAEVGSPQELLDKSDSIFSSMARDANINTNGDNPPPVDSADSVTVTEMNAPNASSETPTTPSVKPS